MAALGLDVRLEIRRAAEISAQRLVEDARAVAAADDKVVLARDDKGGALEIGCVGAQKAGRDGDQLAGGERLLGSLSIGNHGAVVGARFEEHLNGAEDVGRGDVAAVKDGEGAGPLQTCDPRREPFEHDLRIRPFEPVAGKNDGVGDGWVARYQRVRGEGAKGVTDENKMCRFADRSVFAISDQFRQGGKNSGCNRELIVIA